MLLNHAAHHANSRVGAKRVALCGRFWASGIASNGPAGTHAAVRLSTCTGTRALLSAPSGQGHQRALTGLDTSVHDEVRETPCMHMRVLQLQYLQVGSVRTCAKRGSGATPFLNVESMGVQRHSLSPWCKHTASTDGKRVEA